MEIFGPFHYFLSYKENLRAGASRGGGGGALCGGGEEGGVQVQCGVVMVLYGYGGGVVVV